MQDAVVGTGERYRAIERIAVDSLGTLWYGVSERSGAAVCVRFLASRLTSDPNRVRRATAELRSLHWRLTDPHVARVLDHDLRSAYGRGGFVVYEAGGSDRPTRTLAQEPPSSTRRALEVIAAVAGGLAAAHGARVFHRGLTATSVTLDREAVARIVDLGLGELLVADDRGSASGPRTFVGQGAVDVLALARLFDELRSRVVDLSWRVPRDVEAVLAAAASPHSLLRPHPSRIVHAIGAALEGNVVPSADPDEVAVVGPVDVMEPVDVTEPEPELGRGPAPEPVLGREPEPEPAPVLEPELEPEPEVLPASGYAEVSDEEDVGSDAGTPRRWRRRRAHHRSRDRRALLVAILSVLVLVGAGLGGVALLGGDDDDPAARRTPSETQTATSSPTPSTVPLVRATVPDLIGLRVGRATSALQEAGLVLGSVTTVPGPAGIVVRTEPTPGEAVVATSAVDVFVGNGAQG